MRVLLNRILSEFEELMLEAASKLCQVRSGTEVMHRVFELRVSHQSGQRQMRAQAKNRALPDFQPDQPFLLLGVRIWLVSLQ